jgi:hypothetical protein
VNDENVRVRVRVRGVEEERVMMREETKKSM